MLFERNILNKHNNKKIVLIILATFTIFCVRNVVNNANDNKELSEKTMSCLFGGEICCDNCAIVSDRFAECLHYEPYPDTPVCRDDGCIMNIMNTASCQAGQQNADGCDTDTVSPQTAEVIQNIYMQVDYCVAYGGAKYSIWKTTYYGCDTGSWHLCQDNVHLVACGTTPGCIGGYLQPESPGKGAKKKCSCD